MAAKKKANSRVVIGVDPHKRIDAVVVLDELGAVLAREIVPHTSRGVQDVDAQARQFPNRVWAVGLGREHDLRPSDPATANARGQPGCPLRRNVVAAANEATHAAFDSQISVWIEAIGSGG